MIDSDTLALVRQAQQEIRDALTECAVLAADRDNRIRTARDLGISVTDIAALVGLSRNHVHCILSGKAATR